MVTDKDVAEELHEVEHQIKRAAMYGMTQDEKMALASSLLMLNEVVRHRYGITSAYWMPCEMAAEKLYREKYEREDLFK